MKLNSRATPLLASAVLALGLAGCATGPQKSEAHAHAAQGSPDMHAMCEMHKQMMSGAPSAQQHAMMQEHMKSMTPEMRQRMHAMHGQCK